MYKLYLTCNLISQVKSIVGMHKKKVLFYSIRKWLAFYIINGGFFHMGNRSICRQVMKSVNQITWTNNLQRIMCRVPLYLTVLQLNLLCTLLVIWNSDLLCVIFYKVFQSTSLPSSTWKAGSFHCCTLIFSTLSQPSLLMEASSWLWH